MDNFNASGVYGLPPCAGGSGMIPAGSTAGNAMTNTIGSANAAGMVPHSSLPTLEDIAGYNYLSPQQQQQQRELLSQAGNMPFKGNPRQMTQSPSNNILAPIAPNTQPMPMTAESLQYMNGFLRTQIGRPVKVDFLIGTNTMVDKTGILLAVGVNYILINEIETDDVVACDFYNIKFIKFYY